MACIQVDLVLQLGPHPVQASLSWTTFCLQRTVAVLCKLMEQIHAAGTADMNTPCMWRMEMT